MFEFDGILLKPCLLQPCFHVAGKLRVFGRAVDVPQLLVRRLVRLFPDDDICGVL